MSNSSLICYTKISPHKNSPRNDKIRKITIHHMAGNISIETCGSVFQSRQASSNYGIGSDGRIAMYVEEKDRSWASSSPSNDHQAVTIEVANDVIGGNWHVSDKALESLVNLCTDICQRNGIERLNFTGDKNGNLTMHRYFAATNCPGPYLESKFPWIAEEVNKRLLGEVSTPSTTSPTTSNSASTSTPTQSTSNTLYRVQTGAYSNKENAEKQLAKVKAAGFDTYMVQVGNLYKIQVGAYSKIENANAMAAKLKAAGFDTYITTEGGQAASTTVAKKSVTGIAKEVIQGKWGVGADRKKRLEAAGYDYNEVQRKVNEML